MRSYLSPLPEKVQPLVPHTVDRRFSPWKNGKWTLRIRQTGFFLAFTAALLIPATAHAFQTPATEGESLHRQEVQQPQSEVEPGQWPIVFEGGPLADFIGLLRETAPREHYPHLNIVVVEDSPEFMLPSIQATTDLQGYLGLIEACHTPRFRIEVSSDGRTESITTIRVVDEQGTSGHIRSSVYNVKSIIAEVSDEDFATAVDLALEFSDSKGDVMVKIHKETGLLFAKGPSRGLNAIDELINAWNVRSMVGRRSGFPGEGGGNSEPVKDPANNSPFGDSPSVSPAAGNPK